MSANEVARKIVGDYIVSVVGFPSLSAYDKFKGEELVAAIGKAMADVANEASSRLEKAQADLKDEMAVSNARRHTSDNLADALEVARRENARLKGLVAIDAMLKMHEDMMQLREEICERAKERDVALLQVESAAEIIEAARAVDAQWRAACTYDTQEILRLRRALAAYPLKRNCVHDAAREFMGGCKAHHLADCRTCGEA